MFSGMSPASCACLIGQYRGSASCPELVGYEVHVPGDKVGVDSRLVAWQIGELENSCRDACTAFEVQRAQVAGDKAAELLLFVKVLCDALERFFWIHPYANGNGHSGRLLVSTLLARHGFPALKWHIDQKVPYDDALKAYRNNNKKPLIRFILQSIRP